MRQHEIKHLNARACWETLALSKGEPKIALIVETDLVIDPEADGYDPEKFQSLQDAAKGYSASQKHIDTVVFYKIGG